MIVLAQMTVDTHVFHVVSSSDYLAHQAILRAWLAFVEANPEWSDGPTDVASLDEEFGIFSVAMRMDKVSIDFQGTPPA